MKWEERDLSRDAGGDWGSDCFDSGTAALPCSSWAAKYERSRHNKQFIVLFPLSYYNTAVAFTEVSESIDIDEDGGMGMFCVAIVDDDNGGVGTTTAITVSLSTPIIGGTNPVGMCNFLELMHEYCYRK